MADRVAGKNEPGLATWVVLVGLAVVMATGRAGSQSRLSLSQAHRPSAAVEEPRDEKAGTFAGAVEHGSITVRVVGEVAHPGEREVPAGASTLDVLKAAGGTTPGGTLRQVEILRGGKRVQSVDFYGALKGPKGAPTPSGPGLASGDTVRVPPIGPTVALSGKVTRPGVFEIVPGETVGDVLRFAGGLDFTRNPRSIRILSLSGRHGSRSVALVAGRGWEESEHSSIELSDEDLIVVR